MRGEVIAWVRVMPPNGVQWVEAMFHELDIVLKNIPAVLLHLCEYITNETILGHGEKVEGCSFAPPFQVHSDLFLQFFFAVVCATGKKVQTTKGA